MKNKKGFTLVELLAVIVILALIMGIAVVSIGSVISTSKDKAFRETAANILNGVRQRFYIENETASGSYSFASSILEKGGTTSPYGTAILYDDLSSCSETNKVGKDICKKSAGEMTCSKASGSFVYANNNTYKICLVDTDGYNVYATDAELLNQSSPAIINSPSAT